MDPVPDHQPGDLADKGSGADFDGLVRTDLPRAHRFRVFLLRMEMDQIRSADDSKNHALILDRVMQLDGMHRVSREILDTLPGEDLRRLVTAGAMEKIYSHLLSLDNFRRLLNRRSFFALQPPSDQRELN